jgi:predicted short-subunit dehydrogenase-like oxidoreductase (DUF2520 family)
MTTVRIIGPGRAGLSFAGALASVGVDVKGLLGHGDDLTRAARGVDLVLIAVVDRAINAVATEIEPVSSTVIAHCSGALGLEVLEGHARVAVLHPLVTIPDPVIGSARLCARAWFALEGDDLAGELVAALGGRALQLPASSRAAYHAAACIASNHLVALLGQVERIAYDAGVPFEAFLALAWGALEDVGRLGPAGALTGPAARGDLVTIERHRRAIDASELDGYDAGLALARRLAAAPRPRVTEQVLAAPGERAVPEVPPALVRPWS